MDLDARDTKHPHQPDIQIKITTNITSVIFLFFILFKPSLLQAFIVGQKIL